MPHRAIARRLLAQFSLTRQAGDGALLVQIESALDSQRDRLALLVPVAIGLGIIAWQVGGDKAALALLCAALGIILLAWRLGFEYRLARLAGYAAVLICLGFTAIMIRSANVGAQPLAKPWIGTFNAKVISVEDVSAREIVRYELLTGGHAGLPPHVRVNVKLDRHAPEILPGSIIQLKARLMPPQGTALPGSYDFARYAWFSGIGATGTALSAPKLIIATQTQSAFWQSKREGLARHIRASMPEGTGAVGAALLVGTRGAISLEDANALRNSGMAHLLSVSGLHVTAVVGGAFLLFSRLLSLFPFLALRLRVPILAAGGSAVVAVAYTLLTGAEVPTVRACIAALLILIALALGREALSLRLLATGACFVLLIWPEALAGPSFQLSFAAVATIIVLHESQVMQRLTGQREEQLLLRTGRMVLSLLITGLMIELILAPIAIFHFHKSGLYGAAANIVAIPLTTFFIMPLQIVALLFDSIGAGAPFWWLAGQGVAAINILAHWVSDAPGAVVALPSVPRWAFALVVTGGLWCAIIDGGSRRWGAVPVAIGIFAMILAPRPDMLVTGDGRHLAVVDSDGKLVLLRSSAGDYAVSMLNENAALTGEPTPMDTWPDARCSADICTFVITRQGRSWSIMATRSRYLVPSMELAAACNKTDIVISERYLPRSCKPRWFKADRGFFERNGGLAIYFADARVDTVQSTNFQQPWSQLKEAKNLRSPQPLKPKS
jgi:competence protein ComEC